MNIKRPGSIIIVSTEAHLRYVFISATAHTQVSRSLICCSLASLSSADSEASRSRWRVLICCSLASLSSADSEASRSRWRVLICCSLASLSLQLIWWPVGPSSVVAWPLSLQLTWWPVGHVFAAEVIAFVRQSEQRA